MRRPDVVEGDDEGLDELVGDTGLVRLAHCVARRARASTVAVDEQVPGPLRSFQR